MLKTNELQDDRVEKITSIQISQRVFGKHWILWYSMNITIEFWTKNVEVYMSRKMYDNHILHSAVDLSTYLSVLKREYSFSIRDFLLEVMSILSGSTISIISMYSSCGKDLSRECQRNCCQCFQQLLTFSLILVRLSMNPSSVKKTSYLLLAEYARVL